MDGNIYRRSKMNDIEYNLLLDNIECDDTTRIDPELYDQVHRIKNHFYSDTGFGLYVDDVDD
jgi:uncharacterized protein YcbK (DUF882 family)